MILTVTLNPSVDISYKLAQLEINAGNRVKDVSKTAGGKGLNVSRVLKQLGQDVGATGFLGGTLGAFIRNELLSLGVDDFFVDSEGATRNCIAILHDDGQQTEILEGGPNITIEEVASFLKAFHKAVGQAELVTVSGSFPQGVANDFYNQLLTIAAEEGTPVLLDTGGALLEKALNHDHKPFLIKPNESELADLLGHSIGDEQQLIKSLQHQIFSGVEWVVITLGAEGAMVKHQDKMYRAFIPKVEAINPVGSGDSVIAGFATGLSRQMEAKELIRFGLTMGVLNAMEDQTGHIDPAKVDWCVDQIRVEEYTRRKGI